MSLSTSRFGSGYLTSFRLSAARSIGIHQSDAEIHHVPQAGKVRTRGRVGR